MICDKFVVSIVINSNNLLIRLIHWLIVETLNKNRMIFKSQTVILPDVNKTPKTYVLLESVDKKSFSVGDWKLIYVFYKVFPIFLEPLQFIFTSKKPINP